MNGSRSNKTVATERELIATVNTERRALEYIESRKTELYGLLLKLLSFDTQNYITHGGELECQRYVYGYFRSLGLETELYSPDDVPGTKRHPDYLAGRGMDSRPDVTAVYPGEDGIGAVMIAAHTDTMPVGDPGGWTVDPFGEQKDGRIYGVGAGDNKCGVAAGMFIMRMLGELGVKLRRPLIVTAYTDEEYGGGDGALGACLKYPCDTYVNLDGGNFEIWNAALGGCGYRIRIGAGFKTDTAAPVTDALYMVFGMLSSFAERRRAELERNPLYACSVTAAAAFRLMEFQVGSFGSDLDSGELKFVIYTTSEKRIIDAEIAELTAEIKEALAGRGMKLTAFEPTTRFFNYAETEDCHGAMAELVSAAEEVRRGKVKQCGACLSDLSVFMSAGCRSSFNFGIFRDFSVYGGAHQPDEYVETGDFVDEVKALTLFVLRHCG